MTGPARITIELEPPTRARSRWVARTRVEEPATVGPAEPARFVEPTGFGPGHEAVRTQPAPMEPLPAPEQREPAVVPAGYEPPEDCTCLDGFCDADHANE